ncbi:MAG: deoxyribonuclease IV [Dehalococcoidia bacterium]|nr:deoxyribonuclease IV [Dehalococcoidia bacterium]
MLIGAQISSAGGLYKVFERAAEIGAEAIQVFLSAPQQWKPPTFNDEQVAAFRSAHAASSLPVFVHGSYLMNFGSKDEALLNRSVASLRSGLRWAGELGMVGTVFHVGSHLGAGFEAVLPNVCARIREAMEASPNESRVLLETNAGQGNCIGRTFAELGAIIRGLDGDPRVGVCFDTCHVFAMGYDIANREGCEQTMEEFEREIGVDRLVAVHANDSKMPLGGVRDRHENIGEGEIGLDGFRTIMQHAAFRDVPFLLEVPGFEGNGPDAENVARLKAIRDSL